MKGAGRALSNAALQASAESIVQPAASMCDDDEENGGRLGGRWIGVDAT